MNKTLTINLGGQLFEIEENAYHQLDVYINSLKTYFKNDADGEEIVNDIEARIAELFIEQQTNDYKIIIKEQVAYVKMKMGTVKDFEAVEEAEGSAGDATIEEQAAAKVIRDRSAKKLMRDNDDRVLGGVSAGLGYYFNVSSLLFRALFLVLLFMGPGVIIYVIFWIIVPKATTAADKLLMKGLPVNVNTLADSVKTRTYSNNKLIDFVGQLIIYFTKFAMVVAKLLLIVIGMSLLFGLVAVFVGVFFAFIMGGTITNLFAVGSGLVYWFVKLMLLFSLAIPIVFIFVVLVYLLFNRNYFKANYVLPLAGLWLISIFCVGLYGKALTNDFENENIVKQTTTLNHSVADTLFIAVKESDANIETNNFVVDKDVFNFITATLYLNEVTLKLQPSATNKLNLTVEKFAKGKTATEAAQRATLTNYNWQLSKDTLWLPNNFALDKKTKWRKQEVDLLLEIPEGKVIKLTKEADDILIDDIENLQGIKGYNMNGRTWLMTANGLDCLDCDDDYEKIPQNVVGKDVKQMETKVFEAIEIRGVVELNLKQGNHKVIISDNKRYLKPFEYTVKDGLSMLQIATKNDMDDVPELDIWLPDLKKLLLEGASSIDLENFELDEFVLIAEGAHSIDIDNIEVNYFKLEAEGAGTYKFDGVAKVFDLNSEGLANINAIKLKTENTTVNIEGAAVGQFWVTENFEINIEGPASIKYKGEPKVKKSISRLASLKQIK